MERRRNARAKRGWALALSESFARRGLDLEAATLLRIAPPASSGMEDRKNYVTLNMPLAPTVAAATRGFDARV